jgi:multicomponent Na+:H+ antiporter subunit C
MFFLLSFVVGGLFAAGLYLMLRRSMVKLIFGLVLLSHAANLLIFTAGGLVRARPPLIPPGKLLPGTEIADPVPQALILTAIVISFAVIAFAAVLVQRVYRSVGSGDVDELKATDI